MSVGNVFWLKLVHEYVRDLINVIPLHYIYRSCTHPPYAHICGSNLNRLYGATNNKG